MWWFWTFAGFAYAIMILFQCCGSYVHFFQYHYQIKSNQFYWDKIQTRTGLSPMKTWRTIIDKLLSTSQEKGHCFRIFLWDWTSSLCYSELVHRIMDILFQSSTKITKYIRTHRNFIIRNASVHTQIKVSRVCVKFLKMYMRVTDEV